MQFRTSGLKPVTDLLVRHDIEELSEVVRLIRERVGFRLAGQQSLCDSVEHRVVFQDDQTFFIPLDATEKVVDEWAPLLQPLFFMKVAVESVVAHSGSP